jgi:RimJ/RimL family protein N-acetyltransferase
MKYTLNSFPGSGEMSMPQLATMIFRFGFYNLDLHRIEAGVATENDRSIRILERIGMTREGIRRKILPIRGK